MTDEFEGLDDDDTVKVIMPSPYPVLYITVGELRQLEPLRRRVRELMGEALHG